MALLDMGTAPASTIGNPTTGNYFIFLDNENSDRLTTRDEFGVDTVYTAGIIPSNLDDLDDVIITSVSNGQSLTWNGSKWVNGSSVSSEVDSTGILTGGILSVGSGSDEFSISDGTSQYVTPTGVTTSLSFSGHSNIPVTPALIAANIITFVGINASDVIIQQASPFTVEQAATIVVLGVIVHVDKVNVNDVNNEQHVVFNVASQLHAFAQALGFFNGSGNEFIESGADLTIKKLVGSIHVIGAGYPTSSLKPNIKDLPEVDKQPFQYRYNNGTSGTNNITIIDPTIIDLGNGAGDTVGGGKYTAQWIFLFPSGNVKIQAGQKQHNDLKKAREGIKKDKFIVEPSIKANGLLRGWLVIKENVTDIEAAIIAGTAEFIEADKFGLSSGGIGGISLTDLQTAFNNSIDPEIVIPTGKELSIQSETDGTQIVSDWKDELGVVKASMTGDGNLVIADIKPNGFVILNGEIVIISTGAVTATTSLLHIGSEGGASTDDLETINGVVEGALLYIHPNSFSETIVLKDGSGNLRLNSDFTMNNGHDTMTLIGHAGVWQEVSRSDNGS